MYAESVALLVQAGADALSARDARTHAEYWTAMKDCFDTLALVSVDDTEAQERVAVARAELTAVMEQLFASGD